MKNNSSILAFLAQGLNVGIGLLLIPLVTTSLNDYYVGLWFVFITAASFNQLLEMGFLPNLSRNISYVFGGAKEIIKEGIPEESADRDVDMSLMGKVISSSKMVYFSLVLISIVVILSIGILYISSLYDASMSQGYNYDLMAFVIYMMGSSLQLYFNYINCVVLGLGEVDRNNKITIIARTLNIVLSMVFINHGLLGLALANLLSILLSRLYAIRVYKKSLAEHDITIGSHTFHDRMSVIKIISHNTFKVGISQLSAFLILRANIFIAASILGVAESSSFSLMVSIVSTLSSLSTVFVSFDLPNIIKLQVTKNRSELVDRISLRIVQSIGLFIVLAVLFNLVGREILLLLNADAPVLGATFFYLCFVIYLLELNHVVSAMCITTANQVPFVKSGIVSGIAICACSIAIAPVLGIWGLLLSQALVQLAYNNWKWPLYLSKLLGTSYSKLLRRGFAQLV
ncbi:O-unit flippase-like protein [Enterovibrio norvegicus]|uniref:O-unit flippase-like protein n=1 Tax=Enterovibrio norvegicus TaxID=188144 RepID=UPI000C82050B|nr:O-unit flippase-like protein [Enterovibrio norvegicus]PMH72475.1 hypothetical protein BCU62_02350 [Enterovibrio norvegicus]